VECVRVPPATGPSRSEATSTAAESDPETSPIHRKTHEFARYMQSTCRKCSDVVELIVKPRRHIERIILYLMGSEQSAIKCRNRTMLMPGLFADCVLRLVYNSMPNAHCKDALVNDVRLTL